MVMGRADLAHSPTRVSSRTPARARFPPPGVQGRLWRSCARPQIVWIRHGGVQNLPVAIELNSMSDAPAVEVVAPTKSGAHGTPTGKRQLFTLALASLGVVFGDIGTSPLYAVRECLSRAHGVSSAPENVFGIVSLVFWALMAVISLKYVAYVLKADNQGEGGVLALTALATTKPLRPKANALAIAFGLFGASLLFGDGIITPAISVLSAIEGLNVATPAFEPLILPLASIILVFLFSAQRRGTGSVGAVFGP